MGNKIRDLSHMRFGRLYVTDTFKRDNKSRIVWLCKCDCGNEVYVSSINLVKGTTSSCGCIRRNDLSGKRFGRLTVLRITDNHVTSGGRKQIQYLCKCDCGKEVTVKAEHLRNGNTKSCGCFNADASRERSRTHGLSDTRLHRIWQGMKQRCYYKNGISYKNYGGRGISICDEWKEDFNTFYDWAINNGYADNLSIDRKDVDKGYSPDNCRWATNIEQASNKRNNHIVVSRGESRTITSWSNKLSISKYLICKELKEKGNIDALNPK